MNISAVGFGKKHLIAVGAALIILGSATSLFSQEVLNEDFIGRGVSAIVDGDIAGARRNALADAQEKVIMEAVCARLSIEDITKYFLTLKNLFFNHPDIYLQRFKIINENALLDLYHMTIQGFVQRELLRHDLESMGIVGPGRGQLKVLLMISEKGIDQTDETFWWSPDGASFPSAGRVQQTLEKYFIEKGSQAVDPFQTPVNVFPESIGLSADPDVEAVCRFADRLGAHIVVLGKSELKRTEGQKLSSLVSIQCDMSAAAIDVRNRAVIVQAATYALGIHIDESFAAEDAIDKSCRRLSEQIIDKIYLKMRSMHEYIFRLTFNKSVDETEVKGWLDIFINNFPEIELIDIEKESEKQLWSVKLNSPIKGANILQKMFEVGFEGYETDVVSVNENVIELRVLPVKD